MLTVLLALLQLSSCSPYTPEQVPLNRVTIMYAAAYSNLAGSISEDVEEMCKGELPTLVSGDVFLLYTHYPTRSGDYRTPTSPVLCRVWRSTDGTQHRDTLKTYPDSYVSSTAGVMREVLSDVKEMFPAPHYGLLVSSHGKGWIPKGYLDDSYYAFSTREDEGGTREFCIESADGSGINADELSDAIPMKLDYMIMDSCLMGCVEVAYELREKCGYLLFSPAEILTDGMDYVSMASLLTNVHTPQLETAARNFFQKYDRQSGLYRSVTSTLVDCSKVDGLARICKEMVSAHRETIDSTPASAIQPYFYNSFRWFYDLRDIFVQTGATEEELAELDAALSEFVVYSGCTPSFFNLDLERVCGVSMYFPNASFATLNDYYKGLGWNKAIGLIP